MARKTLRELLVRHEGAIGIDVVLGDILDPCGEPHDPPPGHTFQSSGLVLTCLAIPPSFDLAALRGQFYEAQNGSVLVPLIGIRVQQIELA